MERRPVRAVLLALPASLLLTTAPVHGASAAVEAERLTSIAATTIGKRFQLGADGPTRFCCSGLVWYIFSNADLADRIGGKRMRAREYQRWFPDRGLLSAGAPEVGDLIFYENPAKHTGLVTGFNKNGKPLVTTALTNGVRQHRYDLFNVPRFHSYGHVTLGSGPDPTPSPTPSPTPPNPTPIPTTIPTPQPTPTPEATASPSTSPSPAP